MKCPKCQTDSREGAKFCTECGHGFEPRCPQCGRPLLPAAKYCEECGRAVAHAAKSFPPEIPFEDKLAKIQRYLPDGLTEKILSQKGKIEGERKLVTVMFCDMEGFTPLVEKLGPEESHSVMDQLYDILIHKVHDYGGTVNEMTGDGIMALFGAPRALEDAPQRAIRSAQSIHREMVNFSESLKQEKGLRPIRMRIGLHTGPVVLGTLGHDLRVEFTAVGDTVNLASRMERLAEPGTTCVTHETFRLAEGFFRFEALGERQVKGKEKPVRVFRVLGPTGFRTKFDVSAERGLSPFVGRGRELELLLEGFDRAKAGRGQAFSIVSEAGVGKSRVLYEFRKTVANEGVTFLEGRCLSYSRGVAYHAITDILRSNFGIREDDEDREVREKVRRGLRLLGGDELASLPYLLELLGVKDSGIDRILISPEGKKDQIIEALKRIALKGSEIRPLIMAVEDLHWMDKSSEELMKHMLDSIPAARILLIFTYRPEFVFTWGARSFHNHITLTRLSNREILKMMTFLLGTQDIDNRLEHLILEKTDGVPFFIEQFIKSLKDLNLLEWKGKAVHLTENMKTVAIPSTIQDVIMARVDLFPEEAKEVLQTAALIEREFAYELIREAMGIPEKDLLSRLSLWKDAELVYERGVFPQSTYIFKHSLTQEVVQDSILARKQKRLHEQIGRAMERLYRDKIEEQAGVMAEHFIASGNNEKGAEYSKVAARKAQKAGSYKEAIAHARKRVLCLERLPAVPENRKKIIDARTALAGYFLGLNQHVDAMEAVSPVVDMAMEMKDQKNLAGIYTALGSFHGYVKEDYEKGIHYLNQANRISRSTGNVFYDWLSSYFLGVILYWYGGECDQALEYFGKSLFLSEKAKSLSAAAFVKGTMSSSVYTFRGKADLAYRMSKESVQAANESGDTHTMGMAYACHGSSCYFRGLFGEAEDALVQAVRYCRKTGQITWEAWSTGWLGFMYCDRGDYGKSVENLQLTISIDPAQRYFPSLINFGKVFLERIKALQGDRNIDLAGLSRFAENNRMYVLRGNVARYIGEIFLQFGGSHLAEAESWIREAIETDRKNGTFWSLAGDHALYARLLKEKNDLPRAKEHFRQAVEIFRGCGADGWAGQYERELARP